MSFVAQWILVIFETGLLLLLLRSLGQLRQQGLLFPRYVPPLSDGGLAVGERAPAFSARNLEGNEVALRDFRGRRILAFVSPQCGACAGTVDALNELVEDQDDVTILVVAGTDRDSNRAYAAEHKARMPVLTPVTDVGREMYRVRGVPYLYALDEEDTIRAAGIVNGKEHLRNLLIAAFGTVAVAG